MDHKLDCAARCATEVGCPFGYACRAVASSRPPRNRSGAGDVDRGSGNRSDGLIARRLSSMTSPEWGAGDLRIAGAVGRPGPDGGRGGLRAADAGAGGRDPGGPRRPGRAGGRPDGDRQDRGVPAADVRSAAAPRQHELLAGAPSGSRPDHRPDAGAGDAGRRVRQDLRPDRSVAGRGRVRRRADRAADEAAAGRGRDPRGNPRSAARPRRPAHRQPEPGRGPRPRRGRSDARHGLPARHPPDHRAGAEAAADAALLGNVLGRHPAPGGDPAPRPGHGRGRTAEPGRRGRPAARLSRRSRPQGGPPRPPDRRERLAPGPRLHPDEDRRVTSRELPRPPRARGRRDPLGPQPARPDAGPRGLQDRLDPGPGRNRRRRPGPRHRGPAPRRELRAAVAAPRLRPPDRADRPGRRDRRRREPRLDRRGGPAAGRPAAPATGDPVDGRDGLRAGSQRGGTTAPGWSARRGPVRDPPPLASPERGSSRLRGPEPMTQATGASMGAGAVNVAPGMKNPSMSDDSTFSTAYRLTWTFGRSATPASPRSISSITTSWSATNAPPGRASALAGSKPTGVGIRPRTRYGPISMTTEYQVAWSVISGSPVQTSRTSSGGTRTLPRCSGLEPSSGYQRAPSTGTGERRSGDWVRPGRDDVPATTPVGVKISTCGIALPGTWCDGASFDPCAPARPRPYRTPAAVVPA